MARRKKKKIKINEVIYHSGDDLQKIAQDLTGHAYLMYRLLEKNGFTVYTIKDGDFLKWE